MKSNKILSAPTAGAVYCLSSIITKAITLITTPIFTRAMDSGEYGRYILYISLYGICSAAASVGASSGVIYNVFQEKEDKKREISFAGFLTSVPISAVICILLFAFSGVLKISVKIIPLLFVHTLLDVLILSYLLKYRYSHRAWRVFGIEILKAIVTVPISYYLVAVADMGYLGRALGFVITLLPFAIVALFSFGKSLFHIPKKFMSRVIKNSMPAALSALFLSFGVYAVNIFISIISGDEALAVFSVFNTVATAPIFVITAFISAVAPRVQELILMPDTEAISQIYKNASKLIGCVIMLISLLSSEAISFLAPSNYSANIFIILPLLLYSYLKLSDQFISCVLNARRIYRYSLISNLIFSLSSLAVLLLAPKDLTLLFAGVGLCVGVILSVAHKSFHLIGSELSFLSFADVFLPTLTVFSFSLLAVLLKGHPAVRTLLAIIPIVKLLDMYFLRRVRGAAENI